MTSVALTATSTNRWTLAASVLVSTSAVSAIEALDLERKALISRDNVSLVMTPLVPIVMSRRELVRSVCQASILKELGVSLALDTAKSVNQLPSA